MSKFFENLPRQTGISLLILFIAAALPTFPQDVWLNFTNSNQVNDIVFEGKNIWVATSGGLLRIDSETNEQIQFNRSNSGIPSNNISCIFMDRSGVLWIGTYDNGVANYDGKNWNTFDEFNSSLTSEQVLSFLQDDEGIIWIGTQLGIYRYYNASFHNDLNAGVMIRDMIQDKDGIIWIGKSDGITKIDNYRFEFLGQMHKPYPFFDVRDLAVGSDKKVWILSKEGVASWLNGKFYKLDMIIPGIRQVTMTCIAVDSNNNLWLGSPHGIVVKYNGINFEIYNSENSELSSTRINKLKIDSSGTIWACTNRGLYKYKSRWEYIATSETTINIDQNTRIFSDHERNIWFTSGGDLYLFGKSNIRHYGKNNSKFRGAYTFCSDKAGTIWIGHQKGLTSFDGSDWKEYDTLQSILLKREQDVFNLTKDSTWVRANYKDYLIDSNSYFKPEYYVTKTYLDDSGTLWLKAEGYLVKYHQKEWTVFDQLNSGMPTNEISSLTSDDNNNLWIGTFKHGLYKYDGDEFISLMTSGSFPDTNIVSLHNFNDTLVISTDKRIYFLPDFNLQERNKIIFVSPYVRDIFKDSKFNYWFGTRFGLFEFTPPDGRALYDCRNSGLASNYVSSISEDSDGNLWILTSTGGINIFNEKSIVNEKRIQEILAGKGTMSPTSGH